MLFVVKTSREPNKKTIKKLSMKLGELYPVYSKFVNKNYNGERQAMKDALVSNIKGVLTNVNGYLQGNVERGTVEGIIENLETKINLTFGVGDGDISWKYSWKFKKIFDGAKEIFNNLEPIYLK